MFTSPIIVQSVSACRCQVRDVIGQAARHSTTIRDRAARTRPEVVPVVEDALAAVREFADWLDAATPRMTAEAGVGEARFDWYMRNAKLLPWTADEMALLAQREWGRLMGFLALEEARNRDLPALPRRQTRPSTKRVLGARTKMCAGGWCAGVIDHLPRVHELMYLFGIFPATRVTPTSACSWER